MPSSVKANSILMSCRKKNQLTGSGSEYMTLVATPMLVPLRNHLKTSDERGVRILEVHHGIRPYPA